MKLIMGSSFVRKKMASGKGMPPEIRALLKKIGIVGVEEEADEALPLLGQARRRRARIPASPSAKPQSRRPARRDRIGPGAAKESRRLPQLDAPE